MHEFTVDNNGCKCRYHMKENYYTKDGYDDIQNE